MSGAAIATSPIGSAGSAAIEAGLERLLDECLGLVDGDRLLVVTEPDQNHYRDDLGWHAARLAVRRGADVRILAEPVPDGPERFPDRVRDAMLTADHTVFFSRLGSQARFVELPGAGAKVAAYTLDAESLGSPFAALPYSFLKAVHDALVRRIAGASHASITCPNGTDLTLSLDADALGAAAAMTPFTVRNFPIMIFPPVSSAGMSGRLVLSLALLGTSIHTYDDPALPLASPLHLDVRNGRIVAIGGEPRQAERARLHLERVGRLVDGDPRTVNSWHAGINPGTFFHGSARDDLGRWGAVAFGSPRYTHFHMVGSDPGEVCGSVFDATIRFDDEILWDAGRFVFLDRPDIRALFDAYGVSRDVFDVFQPIGVGAGPDTCP